jgi:hypothetical protein
MYWRCSLSAGTAIISIVRIINRRLRTRVAALSNPLVPVRILIRWGCRWLCMRLCGIRENLIIRICDRLMGVIHQIHSCTAPEIRECYSICLAGPLIIPRIPGRPRRGLSHFVLEAVDRGSTASRAGEDLAGASTSSPTGVSLADAPCSADCSRLGSSYEIVLRSRWWATT